MEGKEGHSMFVPGQIYRRRDLHHQFGGQQQGGISTPSRFPIILLFTGDSGARYGYHDGWQADGLFLYTGEGQRGDMHFV
jgi:5-methylcytosine-specific restriction protein A